MFYFVRSMRLFLVAAFCLVSLTSCGGLAKQDQKALFTLPEGKRVLVLVDVRPSVGVPPEFATQLGQSISDKLWNWNAVSGGGAMVPQTRILELKKDASAFAQMGIADVAMAADADVVLHLDIVGFSVSALSDDSITQGGAQTLVKVVDRDGTRLWPTATMGTLVEVSIAPAFSEQRNRAGVQKEIIDLLAIRTARMFIKYRLDDPKIAR